jgi:NAD(P)-dependent dehydrogenase (short-subunit alcohol dehydrogenase family)
MTEGNFLSLDSKFSIVLGGVGLIGKAVVKELLRVHSEVLILDIDKKAFDNFSLELGKEGLNCKFEYFDVAALEESEILLEKIISKYDVPDFFINTSYPRTKDWFKSTFSEITLSTFIENLNIHLGSYVWIAKLFADRMVRAQKKGSIVLISSIHGERAQDMSLYEGTNLKENMTYPVIKAGINNFVRQSAAYYGKYNVRVNAVSPGGLEGPVAGSKEEQDEKFKKNYIKKTPLKRMTEPLDVANAVIFLCSDNSSYITGHILNVDGGILTV